MINISFLYHEVQSMLASLLAPDKAQSLERLQFISLVFKNQPKIEFDPEIKIKTQGQNLIISKHAVLNSYSGLLELEYFVRGQRKFLMTELNNFEGEKRDLGIINLDNINKFMKIIGADHEYYYDEQVYKLVGRKGVPVSIFIIIDLIKNNINNKFKKFSFVFKHEVFVEQKLKIKICEHEHSSKAMLYAEDLPVVYAEFCCDK